MMLANTRINLITFGISVEINFKVVFNTRSEASAHVKRMCRKCKLKVPVQQQHNQLQTSSMPSLVTVLMTTVCVHISVGGCPVLLSVLSSPSTQCRVSAGREL